MQVLPDPALFALADSQDFLFQLFLSGDVTNDSYQPIKSPGVVPNWKLTVQHPADCPVRTDYTVCMFITTSRNRVFDHLPHASPILKMNRLEPRAWIFV